MVDEQELRPDWLPDKFRSPEDLARSYSEAENKIRTQGQELSQLREQLASLEFEQEAEPQEQPSFDPMATIKQMVEQQLAPQMQQYAPPAPELVIDQAERLLAAQVPDYADYQEQVFGLFKDSPEWQAELGRAASTGNPSATAAVIAGAVQTLAASGQLTRQASSRDMKLAAQGISGGQSGRPDTPSDQRDWERIVAAGQGTYGELAAKGR
jgi:hypothetical protein